MLATLTVQSISAIKNILNYEWGFMQINIIPFASIIKEYFDRTLLVYKSITTGGGGLN